MSAGGNLARLLDNPEEYLKEQERNVNRMEVEEDSEELSGRLANNSLLSTTNDTSTNNENTEKSVFCVECQDHPSTLFCQQCTDDYCDVCFQSIHRKGTRKLHKVKKLTVPTLGSSGGGSSASKTNNINTANDDTGFVNAEEIMMEIVDTSTPLVNRESLRERSKWIPVRLTLNERKTLRLLEAALTVSEYTDKIDVVSYRSGKPERMIAQIKDLCAILCGLVVAADYQVGQDLIQDKDYKFNESFFRRVFEVGRRHKIMNPDKMHGTYGKLIYLLMDSIMPEVQDLLEFSCVADLKNVHDVLVGCEVDALLDDKLLDVATLEINSDSKSRHVIQKEIKMKEKAIDMLTRKYANENISEESLKQCIYSIGDNNSFLRGNRDPIDKIIIMLQKYFSPDKTFPSLAIASGKNGARLTHSHQRQYYYVLQSLTLWREVNHNMFKLWCLAEQDLLDARNGYRLRDTGQGLNRVQNCPRVSKEMHRIVADVMKKVGSGNWVGSSVIHLGDTNVPNAFIFIDKYTQVPQILSPIVLCFEKIDNDLVKNPSILKYIQNTFSSVEELKLEILIDFFKHAFDGSGADNFFDAGSCIDGRLTSAWNWCNQIEKKRFFPIFLLTEAIINPLK